MRIVKNSGGKPMKQQNLDKALIIPVLLMATFAVVPAMAQGQNEGQSIRPDRAEFDKRRAEFFADNPEAAARLEKRRAEFEARREQFREAYPEAATELERMREDKRNRLEEFRANHPEAAAELQKQRRERLTRFREFRQENPGAGRRFRRHPDTQEGR